MSQAKINQYNVQSSIGTTELYDLNFWFTRFDRESRKQFKNSSLEYKEDETQVKQLIESSSSLHKQKESEAVCFWLAGAKKRPADLEKRCGPPMIMPRVSSSLI